MKASFRVEIAARAESDMRTIHDFIAQDKKRAAQKWLDGALAQARSLRLFPYRYEQIPEAEALGVDCRHIIYGSYRIIYRVIDRRVRILRVIHAARQLTRAMLIAEPSS
jgi:toxin ParE1/3/4